MPDTILIIVGLIVLIVLIQVWSVQRVEYKHRQLILEMQLAKALIDRIVVDMLRHEDNLNTIAFLIHRIDKFLFDEGFSEKLLTDDLIVDDGIIYKE